MAQMADGVRVVRLGRCPGREGEELGLLLEESAPPRAVRVTLLRGVPEQARAQLGRDIARAGDALHHPHIQAPLALVPLDGALGLVSEYADGETLREFLEVGGRLPSAVAARVIHDACAAVHFAHEEGREEGAFVHGWLRPENLLVSRSGVTLVSGFGAAAGRGVDSLVPWLAPEQILGGPGVASPQSDVYGLGLLLHACLAGENPFEGEPDPDVAILSRPPPSLEPLGVPPALAAVARRALSVKAADRFASAGEMGLALEEASEVASPGAVAAWAESLFPAGMGTRALRQRAVDAAAEAARAHGVHAAEEVGEDQILPDRAPPSGPEEGSDDLATGQFQFVAPPFPPPPPSVVAPADILGEAPPAPAAGRPAGRRSLSVAAPGPAPAPPLPSARPRSRGPTLAAVAAVAAAGLALGWWLSGPAEVPDVPRPAGPVAAPAPEPAVAVPVPAPPVAAPRPEPPGAAPARAGVAQKPLLEVTSSSPGDVTVDGRRAGPVPLSRTVRVGRHEVRLVNRDVGFDVVRTVEVRAPRTSLRFEVGKGRLTVTAPDGAEISLDGRKVGTGGVRDLEVWEGRHRLVVSLGPAHDQHDFQVGPNESYEYEVTAVRP